MEHKTLDLAVEPMTRGPKHHFFGYYDKTPWDATGRYLLGLEVDFMDRPPGPDDEAVVGLIDTEDGCSWQALYSTRAWHWQLGAMLQWTRHDPERSIVYNARRDGRFVAVIRDVHSGRERRLPRPVYPLSPDGRTALSLNFARLADTRPGYGYEGLGDPWQDDPHPAEDGVYRVDLSTGESELIISLAQMADFHPRPDMDGAKHWFNHVQINTDGSRFAFLHRWHAPEGPKWLTRLITAAPDGADVRLVADGDMVSHYDWRDTETILAWARQHETGDHYYLFNERTGNAQPFAPDLLACDGHCSWSPDRRWLLTDTYPDEERMRTLILYCPDQNRRVDIGRFHAPPGLDGPIRCDLHPRWNRDGTKVCIDSAHEGSRQIYVLDVSDIIEES
ncbi:MAG: hypothetical protein R6X33_07925 [Candidatus Brocadiia bacterium]